MDENFFVFENEINWWHKFTNNMDTSNGFICILEYYDGNSYRLFTEKKRKIVKGTLGQQMQRRGTVRGIPMKT